MKPTIKDVAKLAGVSFKTVSRVINREPSVSEALQEKVAQEHGFTLQDHSLTLYGVCKRCKHD